MVAQAHPDCTHLLPRNRLVQHTGESAIIQGRFTSIRTSRTGVDLREPGDYLLQPEELKRAKSPESGEAALQDARRAARLRYGIGNYVAALEKRLRRAGNRTPQA
jgi:hypothetical protein